jgi:L-arabinonolactonase
LQRLDVVALDDVHTQLGECPLWDDRSDSLYWIDSIPGWIYRRALATGREDSWRMPREVGAIALAEEHGHLIVALSDGVYALDLASGEIGLLANVAHAAPSIRLNDGKPDPAGRFVVGSIVVGSRASHGALYSIAFGSALASGKATELHRDIGACNGVCFSPDGATLYYADSYAQRIYSAEYAVATGSAGARCVFADLSVLKAWPDGMTIDSEGRLWVVLANFGQLAVFMPGGELVERFDLGMPWATCPTFGGPQLETLFVTTLSRSHSIRSDHPLAGSLLAAKGTGARGIPAGRCRLPSP